MKFYTFFVITCLVVSLFGCTKNNSVENGTPLPVDYNVYNRYSYRGPIAQSDSTFYYCTKSKTDFDSLFFSTFGPSIPDTIPSVDFSTKKVISIVKYGNDFHVLSVKGVTLLNGILEVAYSDTLVSENLKWITVIPIIITTNANFQKIKFVENGIFKKEITP